MFLEQRLMQKILGVCNAQLFLAESDFSKVSFEFLCECNRRNIDVKLVDRGDKRRYTLVPIQQDN